MRNYLVWARDFQVSEYLFALCKNTLQIQCLKWFEGHEHVKCTKTLVLPFEYNISLILSESLFDKRLQQERLVCGTIAEHGFHRDHMNQKRRRGRNITCQSCDRASLHSHITETQSLSSVYYTGLRGEIDLKWQLLGPVLWKVKLTCTQWRLWSTWSYCVQLSRVWSFHGLFYLVTLCLL